MIEEHVLLYFGNIVSNIQNMGKATLPKTVSSTNKLQGKSKGSRKTSRLKEMYKICQPVVLYGLCLDQLWYLNCLKVYIWDSWKYDFSMILRTIFFKFASNNVSRIGQDWDWVDDCWGWVIGTWTFIILFCLFFQTEMFETLL